MVSLKSLSGMALARARRSSHRSSRWPRGLRGSFLAELLVLRDFQDEHREVPGVVAKVVHLLRLFDPGGRVDRGKPALVFFIVVPAVSKFLITMTNDLEDEVAADDLLVVGLPYDPGHFSLEPRLFGETGLFDSGERSRPDFDLREKIVRFFAKLEDVHPENLESRFAKTNSLTIRCFLSIETGIFFCLRRPLGATESELLQLIFVQPISVAMAVEPARRGRLAELGKLFPVETLQLVAPQSRRKREKWEKTLPFNEAQIF